MIHLKNIRYTPEDSRRIAQRARFLCTSVGASIRIVRIASNFIEIDVSVEKDKLDMIIEKLAPIGKVDNIRHVIEETIQKDDGIKEGITYFNNERFWEAHEAWEGAWKQCEGKEKLLLQGIILVAVAFAHSQKNDNNVGINMFARALEKIGDFKGTYHTIDINRICEKIIAMRRSNNMVLFKI